jgi:hypothetical protein
MPQTLGSGAYLRERGRKKNTLTLTLSLRERGLRHSTSSGRAVPPDHLALEGGEFDDLAVVGAADVAGFHDADDVE